MFNLANAKYYLNIASSEGYNGARYALGTLNVF